MSAQPDRNEAIIAKYISDYIADRAGDPTRMKALLDYCLTIPCPSCQAAVGVKCCGAGAHADRLTHYIASEFVTVYAASRGVDE